MLPCSEPSGELLARALPGDGTESERDRKMDRKALSAVPLRPRVLRVSTKRREYSPARLSVFGGFRPYSLAFAEHEPIGAPRFELGTSPTRTVRATRLRHAPTPSHYPTPAPTGAGTRRPGQRAHRAPARPAEQPSTTRHARTPWPPRLSSLQAMPTPLAEITAQLDALLEPGRFRDYCPNGLQVPGAEQVTTVATGVSANVALFEQARDAGAELVVAHHGLFWGSGPGPIDAALARRLRVLFAADISLLAYHLPLDAHPGVGNNALLAAALGARRTAPFAEHAGEPIGCLAELPGEGLAIGELLARTQTATRRDPLAFEFGPPIVRRLGIVTGAGTDYLPAAIAAGVDAFLTGEPAERAMAQAREAGVHFIAAGHYATETFGVRRLGELLAESFGVRHVFLDVPNPV